MDRFGIYRTTQWRKLRKLKLAANPFCQYCPAGMLTAATQVDHRVPIARGGDPWEWSNLASTCHECHSHKTQQETNRTPHTQRTIKGVDACTGLPIDPNHWWRKNG